MRAEILSASAGSGKTFRLAYKYIRDVVENPSSYRNILAVTFTNKATEEMKSRIIRQLHLLATGDHDSDYASLLASDLGLPPQKIRERAQEAQSRILHDYSRFTILTIDKFFQRILRAFIRELGLDLDYSVELDTGPLLEKSAERLIKQTADNRRLQKWLTDFSNEQLDGNRSWNIRSSLSKIGRELFKEQNRDTISRAIPKERLESIIRDADRRVDESRRQIAELAAGALAAMSDAGVSHSDFNRGFTAVFENLAKDPAHNLSATVIDKSSSLDGWFTKKGGAPAAVAIAEQLRATLAEIVDIRNRNCRLWATADLVRRRFRHFALLSDLYEAVTAVCEEENMMLLSETKYLLSKFVVGSDAPFIYEKIGSRFDRYMIDEFQDTSLKEWKNFLPLLQNAMAQSEDTSVLLVGDVKQSIYRWRGGDRNILNEKAVSDLKPENIRFETLDRNYRSLPVVVEFNNEITDRVVSIDNLALNGELDEALRGGRISAAFAESQRDLLSKAYANFRQIPKRTGCEHDGFVDISLYADEPPVIERIKAILDRGFKPKDIMILVRSGKQGVEIAEKLLAFKHSNDDPRYAFDVMTQEALIIGSAPVVKFVIAVLALALDPNDPVQRSLYRRFGGRMPDEPLADEELRFLRSIRMLSPEEAFERTVMEYRLDSRAEHTAYLQALHEQIMHFCTGRVADIALWLERWNETESGKSLSVEQSETTIEIITVHKAKGLEKKVVIIPYCDWELKPKSSGLYIDNYVWSKPRGDDPITEIGEFPVTFRKDMAESFFSEDYYREHIDSHIDNVNLLYVALTRAAESLHVFIADPDAERSAGKGRKIARETVGTLIVNGLSLMGREFAEESDGCRHVCFGEFAGPCADRRKESDVEHVVIGNYPTRKADLSLALPSQRYFDENPSGELTPRNFGILMHRAFAEAETLDDIRQAVARMREDALVSPDEAERLQTMIERALENPTVRGWFDNDGGRAEVRNENAIILPHGESTGRHILTRRPDRVIIRGRRATVVDYKFGNEKKAGYARQTGEYMSLLRKMGYTDVEGYIWYVSSGEVEKV